MPLIEVGLDNLRGLRIGNPAVLPEERQFLRLQAFNNPSGEQPLEHAPGDLSGFQVEPHLQVIGDNVRGSPAPLPGRPERASRSRRCQ